MDAFDSCRSCPGTHFIESCRGSRQGVVTLALSNEANRFFVTHFGKSASNNVASRKKSEYDKVLLAEIDLLFVWFLVSLVGCLAVFVVGVFNDGTQIITIVANDISIV
jgi:hypothetical protein